MLVGSPSRGRNLHSEHRPSPDLALYTDDSVVMLHDPLRNGQTQAGPAQLAAARLVHAVEAFENPGLILRRNTNAGVFDVHGHPSVLFLGRERYFSRRGRVLDSVVE